ncbi:F21J9.9 [Citrus sinensis]|uniref:F21J9.9 n=1 Tax=Citrus sinensis TaxID=2711 RepID=A0ACB8K3E6_CITSI|nr:F21J9.9 [Citrus sinensis]
MELRFSSIENIKPSSPTPDHQRTHKLSFIDQLNPGAYFSIILFYSAGASSERLKKSLSETLTHFYPFAGQFKDNHFVDCDDHGVTFIEAHFDRGDMSEVIQQAKTNILEQLIPCKPHESTRVEHNLIVQVNYFGCGGMAIGVCFHHKVADAATAANFLKTWGLHARGAGAGDTNDFKHAIYDSNSIFPAQDLPDMSVNLGLGLFSLDSVVKRFTFEGEKIASLREKIVQAEPGLGRPSRVEVVSSVILGALLAAYGGSRDDDEEFTTAPLTHVTAIIAVNLRKRMNPPLPEESFGNICSAAFLNLPIDRDHDHEKKINHGSLAGQLHQSIRMVDDQLVRKLYVEGEILNIRKAVEAQGSPKSNKVFVISSWCKMSFYEADFGWGKPVSIGVGTRFTEAAVLVDSCQTDGIEAWVGLSKQDMARFEQHPGILAHTSSSTDKA